MEDLASLCMGCMNSRGGAAICPACGFDENSAPQVAMQLAPRTMLNDQYMVGRALGAGGFAITYLAWDTRLARRVAIKEYMPTGLASRAGATSQVVAHTGAAREDFNYGLERFLEEAQLVAQFQNHPGIISVVNYFPANGTAYLVMEYLEGETLKEHLKDRGGRLDFQEALALMTPVMDALRELHSVNVLHRDISPDNVYVTTSGQVKLLDFGAARQALRDRSQRLSVILKVGYAPEEQYRSSGNQGPWTDVYAVGATLYHLVTGQIPPPSIDRLAEDTIVPPRSLGANMTEDQEAALMTALAVKASQRYPTIQDFQAAIGLPSGHANRRTAERDTPRRTVKASSADFFANLPSWAKPAAGAGGLVLLFAIGFLLFRPRSKPIAYVPQYPYSGLYAAPQTGKTNAGKGKVTAYSPPGWAGPPIQVAHAGEIAPLKDTWPLNDVASMARKALLRAQRWAPDAQLVEIDVKPMDPGWLKQFYIQTDAGTIQVQLSFYSSNKQQAIIITPNAPNNPGQTDGDLYSMGYVDWGDKLAIPANFLPLADAIRQAHLMGMRSKTIREATLENNSPGTTQGGANISGLRWVVLPMFGDGLWSINANSPASARAQ